jgi:hypothetical protein
MIDTGLFGPPAAGSLNVAPLANWLSIGVLTTAPSRHLSRNCFAVDHCNKGRAAPEGPLGGGGGLERTYLVAAVSKYVMIGVCRFPIAKGNFCRISTFCQMLVNEAISL